MLIRKLGTIITASLLATAVNGEGFGLLGDDIWSAFPRLQTGERVEFGTSVALSANGKRLLTGTPFFDYRFDLVNDIQISHFNPQGGAVFLYQLEEAESGSNKSNWTQVWSLFGNETEGIGRYIALSPSGQLVAVRRGDGSVQVYHSSSRRLVGDPITVRY